MSRLPHENRNVKGRDIKCDQNLEAVCSHPYCDVRGRENLEIHHIWPRSFLRGQPIEFVELWDGTVVGNQVYLCSSFKNGHHQIITENEARIEWQPEVFLFAWIQLGLYDELNPQPVLFDAVDA